MRSAGKYGIGAQQKEGRETYNSCEEETRVNQASLEGEVFGFLYIIFKIDCKNDLCFLEVT